MIYELNHVGMFVRDAEKTVDFYEKYLGAKNVFDYSVPGVPVRLVYLQIANGMIEIVDLGDKAPKFGYEHVAFMSDSIDEDYQRLIQAGYSSIEAPKKAASGNGKICFVADPSGVKVELIERESTLRIPTIVDGDIRDFDHISILADDLEASEQFYTQHISMNSLSRKYVEDYDVTFSHLHKGLENLELMHLGKSKVEGDRILHIALRVDDVNAMTEKLTKQGVEFDPDYPKTAAFGGGLTAKFSGPDGEKIELVDRKNLQEI
ncbi:hypothetical protein CWR48_02995 [Oceanobacillus arenosus]|uniref:VOC domain-containing protein n=1 Tax=Oceanobacillus arenosus TaxID=1229153 RepID=A0A3D8PZ01_9BACI|nr:VOC family protein [Oceanobacillus arenosus]RDW21386.1 hypothetical protein CWR48_02995 [Oceanobacillus arenosus]